MSLQYDLAREIEMMRIEAVGEWPAPAPLGDQLLPVPDFDHELLPASLRPSVQDISERMQTPPDFAAAATVVSLAGAVGRGASICPKLRDRAWKVIPNLWGASIALPGFLKSPILRAVTSPLIEIESLWRQEYAQEYSSHEVDQEKLELRRQAWREDYKRAVKKGGDSPLAPEVTSSVPGQRRLVLTDSTFEKLHEILSQNPKGILVLRDEISGWLSSLDKQGREGERGFFLESWQGDSSFTIDRIGRGSIHVPAACVSLYGNLQPSRLRSYLSDSIAGGPGDDGLFQRFQLLVWPDTHSDWHLVDREPNAEALSAAAGVFGALSKLSPDAPIQANFAPDAQILFFDWWADLETKIRSDSGMPAPMVAHLSKYRSLMPSLALLFELADLAATGSPIDESLTVSLGHAQQSAAFCEYLECHARRVYGCLVSSEIRRARDLGQHIKSGHLGERFSARTAYLKGWSGLDTSERLRAALDVLEDAQWVRREESLASPQGGRPGEAWIVNPRLKS